MNNDRNAQKTFTCVGCKKRKATSSVTDEQFAARLCRDCSALKELSQDFAQIVEEEPVAVPAQPQTVVEPKPSKEIRMTKRLYHLIYGYSRLEKAWDYQVKRLLQPGEELQTRKHFTPREVSNFLERNMPCKYIQATWPLNEAGTKEAKNVIMRGINADTVAGYHLDPMYLWYGFVGENIQAVFAPYQVPMEKVGLAIDKDVKIKYPKRVFAPHVHDVQGHSRKIGDDLFEYVVDNPRGQAKLTALVREATKANDGMSLCTPRAAHLITGEDGWEEGDAFRFTGCFDREAIDPKTNTLRNWGMVKGHMMVKEDLAVDLIFFGPKKGMRLVDKAWFGTMGELHAARTKRFDFQSIVDFFQHNGGTEVLAEIAEKTMEERLAMTEDSEAMRRMLLNMHDLDEESNWVLIEALKRDIDPVLPGLWRRIAKTFMPEIDKMGLGRIGADTHLSDGYALRFPDSFDREGKDRPDLSRIRGNFVFTPQVNVDQEVVLYRQPNGNPQEHWKTRTVKVPHWKTLGKGNCLYFSYEMAEAALDAMGGGDFDDRIMIVKNPALVKIFNNLPEYPVCK